MFLNFFMMSHNEHVYAGYRNDSMDWIAFSLFRTRIDRKLPVLIT